MVNSSELIEYKEVVKNKLSLLTPYLVKYSMGDLSEKVPLPEEEDEFTELFVALSIMVDDFNDVLQDMEKNLELIKISEKALQEKNSELEKFNRLSVGRELRMIELKKEVNDLSIELNRDQPYDISFVEKN